MMSEYNLKERKTRELVGRTMSHLLVEADTLIPRGNSKGSCSIDKHSSHGHLPIFQSVDTH